ncbi:MAG: hypothetical protein A2Z50_08195 [Nitrospirae bacterium RBG_19FT_COMBO_42_15]|nr:MAG: hypothetical protein A2Z50_08195 [Nitrospirae bacterium RBG_19FT_COMBO_42_15]
MRILTNGLAIFIIILLFSGCQKNIKTTDVLRPNWSEATLKVTGIAKLQNDSAADRLMSLQRAKSDAYKNLRLELLNIMITDTKTVGEYVKDKEVIIGQIEDFVKRGKVTAVRHIPANNSIEVDIELYLGKGFESIILK